MAIFANFSNVFSSYMDGSRITLPGMQLVRNEIRHSEAEIRMLCDGDVRNDEINSNKSGNFSNVSCGLTWAETSWPRERTAIHGGNSCESLCAGFNSVMASNSRGSFGDEKSSAIPWNITSKTSNAPIVRY